MGHDVMRKNVGENVANSILGSKLNDTRVPEGTHTRGRSVYSQ